MFYIRKLFLTISFLCSALIISGESMGNITSLTRNGLQDGGTCDKVNQLTYSYDGNRLVSVSDAVASPTYNGFFGFNDGADQAVEYEYYANGNMTRDRNKGISSIQYNADNLPLRIQYDNGSTEVTLADNSYDTLGRLSNTGRGGNGMLSTAYTYNVRSWMTGMSGSLFSESLYYTDNPYNTGNRHYGGNISAMEWKAGQTQRAYDLSYDNLSRLTSAKYYETNGRYSTQYTYDSMGNILTLKRNGLQDGATYGLVDNLTYTYNGNQLTKISDSVEDPTYVGAFNFKDGADNSTEYTYDAVGNMTSDKNKGITSITYNDINQPQKITFSDGKTTEYVYSYDGTKLQTIHKTLQPQTSATTTYCGNMIYENGALKQMLVDGGYVTCNGTTPKYHFYIQDHLGNNRVVAKADGTVEQINHYYPYGGLMADICTDRDVQPHKYNGKELNRIHGLDTYDYVARQHNAATILTHLEHTLNGLYSFFGYIRGNLY